MDLGLPINMVADHSVLSGLVSQRLCKTLCPECSLPLSDASARSRLSLELTQRLQQALDDDWGDARTLGDGCNHCGGRGAVGRTVVAEVLRPNAKFYEYIRAGEKVRARDYWLRDMGGINMMQHVLQKIRMGVVDPDMAESAVGYLHDPLK